MAPDLQAAKGDTTSIPVLLKRIRDKHGRYQYGVLAQFPRGVQAESPILGWTPPEGTAKQDAANYITVGLQSAFSNEPYVVPVSCFWLWQGNLHSAQ